MRNIIFCFAFLSAGNGDHSIPGDDAKSNNFSDGNKSNETSSQKSHHINLDWREFRANLFAREQVILFSLSEFYILLLEMKNWSYWLGNRRNRVFAKYHVSSSLRVEILSLNAKVVFVSYDKEMWEQKWSFIFPFTTLWCYVDWPYHRFFYGVFVMAFGWCKIFSLWQITT